MLSKPLGRKDMFLLMSPLMSASLPWYSMPMVALANWMSVAGLCTSTLTVAVACGLSFDVATSVARPAEAALMVPSLPMVTAFPAVPAATDHVNCLLVALAGCTSIRLLRCDVRSLPTLHSSTCRVLVLRSELTGMVPWMTLTVKALETVLRCSVVAGCV